MTEFILNGQKRVKLQLIDISASIMYDKQKALNTFLSLINACVSHELRNPPELDCCSEYREKVFVRVNETVAQ